MAIVKGAGKTALIVVLVLVALHYVAPASAKAYLGTT